MTGELWVIKMLPLLSTDNQPLIFAAAGKSVFLNLFHLFSCQERKGEERERERGGGTQNGLFCYVLIRSCHLLTPLPTSPHFTTQELDAARHGG